MTFSADSTLGLTGCQRSAAELAVRVEAALAYYLINMLLELIEQSNCILHEWFHTFWKELQCVSMAKIVAEGEILLQVVQQ